MKRIIWSKHADADFDDAFGHALELGADPSERLLDLLDDAQLLLAKHPLAGTAISDRGFRKWSLRPLPYALLYEVTPEAILILRFIHLRTNWLDDA